MRDNRNNDFEKQNFGNQRNQMIIQTKKTVEQRNKHTLQFTSEGLTSQPQPNTKTQSNIPIQLKSKKSYQESIYPTEKIIVEIQNSWNMRSKIDYGDSCLKVSKTQNGASVTINLLISHFEPKTKNPYQKSIYPTGKSMK